MRRIIISICLFGSIGILLSLISFPGRPMLAIGCPECETEVHNNSAVGIFAAVPETPENRAVALRNKMEADQAQWMALRNQVAEYRNSIPPTPAQSVSILFLSLLFLSFAAGGNVYFFLRIRKYQGTHSSSFLP